MGGNSFSKWNSVYSKNIPVANVSPMVHGHSTTSSKTKVDVTRPESCDHFKCDIDPNKPVDQKPSSISVSETFGDIKFDERFIDDDLLVLDKNDVSTFSRSRNMMKSLNRQKQLSDEQANERKTVISDCPVQSDVDEEDSIHERKYCTSRSQSADKSRSSSADKSRSSSADKTRSLLAEIANSDGYVAESKVKAKTDDLLTDDPATLGREERALLRAIKRFEEMEERPDLPPSSPKPAKQSNTKLKVSKIKQQTQGPRVLIFHLFLSVNPQPPVI
ncbi:uncharacterized protein LOC110444486 [Mizuhopecten yessoensis]|uniref:uncharacterized protein LOC110444486 n=1 Tax=Mizuhopecten yessoensis TaxID=6573 RepID=UPI000B45BBBF|nr:uncharacterized protein LOC110444486 [Mizuhopecten yessoensis]